MKNRTSSTNQISTEPASSLSERLTPLLENLLYPSESDEPVSFISLLGNNQGVITAREFVELLGLKEAENVAELMPESFWSSVVVDQEWYEVEERERTARFVELKRILEENLEHIQYFEVGEVETGLYLIGQSEEHIEGIKTTAIRT